MSAAAVLLADLDRQGVRFRWGPRGVVMKGDLAKVTEKQRRDLLATHRELLALVAWRHLQDLSEAKFRHPGARLYPFVSLKATDGVLVETSLGPAWVIRVTRDGCQVLLKDDQAQGLTAGRQVGFNDITPPTDPPTPELINLYRPYGETYTDDPPKEAAC